MLKGGELLFFCKIKIKPTTFVHVTPTTFLHRQKANTAILSLSGTFNVTYGEPDTMFVLPTGCATVLNVLRQTRSFPLVAQQY